MHIYDPYSTINANGGFSIGASTSITLLPSTSIIHFDGVNNRVGVGTTAPTRTFSVTGTSYFNGTFTLAGGAGFNYDSLRFAYSNGTSSNNIYSGGADGLNISNQADTEILMRVTNSGNVGIGTINPDVTGFGWNTLTIRGGTAAGEAGVLELQTVTTNTNGQNIGIMAFMDGSSRNAQISVQRDTSTSTANLLFYTNAGSGILERVQIRSSGDFWITGRSTTSGLYSYIYNDNSQFAINASGNTTTKTINFNTSNSFNALSLAPSGAATFTSSAVSNIIFNSTNANGGYLSFQRSGTAAGYIGSAYHLSISGSNADLAMANDSGNLTFVTGGSFTERMRITSGGNVGIGTTGATDVRLFVKSAGSGAGTYNIYSRDVNNVDLFVIRDDGYGYLKAAAWAYGSDRRIKENINYIESGLDKVLSLKPATFDYIDGVKNNIGWIAQDVQEVIPQAVNVISEDNDQLTLKSDFIVPYLVKAIQEQQAQIEELSNKIVALQSK
jgi:hypothetical protein